MSYTVLGDAQVVVATVNTGTATFALCVTNTFLIDNTTSAQGTWVNVYSGADSTPASFNHANGSPANALFVPASGSRLVTGNFGVSGGGQTVIVNSITAVNSCTLIITPVALNQFQSSI